MKKGDKIGIVACSNGLKENSRQEMEYLKDTLEELGLIPVFQISLCRKWCRECRPEKKSRRIDELLPGRRDQRDF